jgi:hypothetical protein
MRKPLFKTTIVIWSDRDPASHELEDIAREATQGEMYCSSQKTVQVDDPATDVAWDGNEFFDSEYGALE